MKLNEEEFKESLDTLGHLYEEAKDCLNFLPVRFFNAVEANNYARVFEILRQMRDLSAINMKKLHTQSEN